MSTVLKLTVADRDVHEIPFSRLSTLTVTNQGSVIAYSDVSSVELVDKTTGEVLDKIADDTPGFESVSGAIHVAKGMAVADAGAHIEKAIVKFGDDPDLLQVQADISDAVRSGAETWTTAVETGAATDTGDDDTEDEAAQLHTAIDAIASHAEANAAAKELGVDGFEDKTPKLDDKKAALHAKVDEQNQA